MEKRGHYQPDTVRKRSSTQWPFEKVPLFRFIDKQAVPFNDLQDMNARDQAKHPLDPPSLK